MKAVEKIIDVIFKAVEWVIAFLVGLMTALVFLQIVNRAILNVSLTWSEEIVNYSMICNAWRLRAGQKQWTYGH